MVITLCRFLLIIWTGYNSLCLYILLANFGPWELGPQHGFARTETWKVHKFPEKVRTESCITFSHWQILVYLCPPFEWKLQEEVWFWEQFCRMYCPILLGLFHQLLSSSRFKLCFITEPTLYSSRLKFKVVR